MRTVVRRAAAHPRRSRSSSQRLGSGSCRIGGSARSPYQATTRASASSSGTPGSPTTRTELARPVRPPEARSSHSPSAAVSNGGQPACATRCTASAETSGATTLAATTSPSGTSASAPVRRSTSSVPPAQDRSTPTTSVSIPSSVRCRTVTRRPTSAGVIRTASSAAGRPPEGRACSSRDAIVQPLRGHGSVGRDTKRARPPLPWRPKLPNSCTWIGRIRNT